MTHDASGLGFFSDNTPSPHRLHKAVHPNLARRPRAQPSTASFEASSDAQDDKVCSARQAPLLVHFLAQRLHQVEHGPLTVGPRLLCNEGHPLDAIDVTRAIGVDRLE